MARTTNPLTNTPVKQVKSADKRQKLSDGSGLQLGLMLMALNHGC